MKAEAEVTFSDIRWRHHHLSLIVPLPVRRLVDSASCWGAELPDCLIPSQGIGDIRCNPVATSAKSPGSGDQPGWGAVGRHRSVRGGEATRWEERTPELSDRWGSRHSTGKTAHFRPLSLLDWFKTFFFKSTLLKFVEDLFYILTPTARMARDMSDKEILKMELDQLKKEVSTPRTPVSEQSFFYVHLFPSKQTRS